MSYTMWSEYLEGEQLTDYSTVKYEEDVYHTSVLDITNEVNTVIQSRLTSMENFVNPAEAYLNVRYQLFKKEGGAAYAATDNIALVNGWSLFQKAELYYNGVNVETIDDPGTASHILGLLEDPEDYKSKGSLEYRFYDTNKQQIWIDKSDGTTSVGVLPSDAVISTPVPAEGAMADTAAAKLAIDAIRSYISSEERTNQGQEGRLARCPPDQQNWIKLKLSDIFGVCKVSKPLRGIQIELRLTKNTGQAVLLRGPNALNPDGGTDRAVSAIGVAVTSRMDLVMPTLKPHAKIFSALNSKLITGAPIPLDYQRIWCKVEYEKSAGGAGTVNYSKRLLSNTKRPRHVFVAIQDSNRRIPAVGSEQLLNPLLFDRPDAVRAYVQVGNVRFPALEYDSSQDGFIRMYNAFLNASGKNADALASSFLTFKRWNELYPIFYFDLSHNDNQFELSMDSEIMVNLTLTNAKATFNLVALVISDEHKEIKEMGQVVQISTVDKAGERV